MLRLSRVDLIHLKCIQTLQEPTKVDTAKLFGLANYMSGAEDDESEDMQQADSERPTMQAKPPK